MHYSDVTWTSWRLKSPATSLFVQPLVQVHIKEKHQSPTSLALVRGIHRWPVGSPHKGPVMRKMFLFADAIMEISLFYGAFVISF